jgi:hypothetical protein
MSAFRVWTCENLYAPWNFTKVNKVNIRNVRFEMKGLGAAEIDVDLNHYSQELRDQWSSGVFTDPGLDAIAPNMYIFIERVDQSVAPLQPEDPGYDATQDPDSDSYVLQDPYGSKIFWWGYISARSLEVQAKSNVMKGSLSCLQIGHRINKFAVRHPKYNENGFNPKIDGRWIGNKRTVQGSIPQFISSPADMATDPSVDTAKYWTVQDVVDYIVHYGVPYAIETDWSLLTDSMEVDQSNRWLKQFEEIPSYEGSDLTSALEDILDTLSWKYQWSEDDESLIITFMDPVGDMDSRYVNQFSIPSEAKEFTITSEEQAFKRVVLRGNRVLVAGSVSTYGGKEHIRVNRDWTNAEATTYTNPLNTDYNISTMEDKIEVTIEDTTAGDVPDTAKADPVDQEKKRILNDLKAEREKTPNVYQHFKLGYADSVSPLLSAGNCLYTSIQPGNWTNEQFINSGSVDGRLIPFFPRIQFMDPNTTYTTDVDGETVTTQRNIDELVYANPVIDNTYNLHQTPIASEMKFSDTIPWKPYTKDNEWFNQPRFYYRTVGKVVEYDTQTVMTEAWQYGDMAGDGLMSSEVSYEWNGIKIKSPAPESFACNFDYLFQKGNIAGDEYDTALQDFGFQRTEWKADHAISEYDPYRLPFLHKGHWGRLIFSFAAYSNQRVELAFGDSTSTDKMKFEDDDSLDLWIIRKGFVPYLSKDTGIGGDGNVCPPVVGGPSYVLPYYVPDDIIVKNDMATAKQRLKTLWNFWSKPKKAVRIVLPIWNAAGEMSTVADTLGNFITEAIDVKSSSTKWLVNSHVASIEYSFESMNPSITYSTEYPESPRRTRERRLKSSWKMKRFNDKNVTNKGVR